MTRENEIVTSVFGKMTRRDLLKQLVVSGLAIGLTGSDLATALAGPSLDDATPPPKEIGGTPFREIARYQSYMDDRFDLRAFQQNGTPKPRTRDVSWFDKPSNATGVSLLQFTNTP